MIMDQLDYRITSFAYFVLQHADVGNEWTGIDGNTGDIVDMKERKVRC